MMVVIRQEAGGSLVTENILTEQSYGLFSPNLVSLLSTCPRAVCDLVNVNYLLRTLLGKYLVLFLSYLFGVSATVLVILVITRKVALTPNKGRKIKHIHECIGILIK